MQGDKTQYWEVEMVMGSGLFSMQQKKVWAFKMTPVFGGQNCDVILIKLVLGLRLAQNFEVNLERNTRVF